MTAPADSYLDPYRQAQRSIGSDWGVTLWASERSQRKRFQVMAHMAMLTGRRVLDAGCSRGDFAAFLIDNRVDFGRFIGIDGLCDVIAYANSRELPRCEFHCGDFVHQPELLRTGDPQVVAISGSLNTMDHATAIDVLESAWAAASESLVFNFLSSTADARAPYQGGPARRLDTMKLMEWALKRTWAVQFRQDYFKLGHDATILMRKG